MLEVCIAADNAESASSDVVAAYQGGATRVELCRDMASDGLTPAFDVIRACREQMIAPAEVLVMVRPRGGNFIFSESEIEQMKRDIKMASEAGADGVVIGVLSRSGDEIAIESVSELIHLAHLHQLKVTFHRAFDCLKHPSNGLEQLVELGVSRILTAGTGWDSGLKAVDGLKQIETLIQHARDRIEIVVGGGVSLDNLCELAENTTSLSDKVSFHAFSGALDKGKVSSDKVQKLSQMIESNR